MAAKFELIGFDTCPYVNRTLIVLNLTQAKYTFKRIDPKNKPEWFAPLSPTGKVPILRVEETTLFESSAINEYINQVTNAHLLPDAPLQQALNRAWTEYCSGLIVTLYKLSNETDLNAFLDIENKFKTELNHLEQTLQATPFFNGDKFCLIDAAYAPFFTKLALVQKHFDLNYLIEKPKITVWSETLIHHDTVVQSISKDYEQKTINRIIETGAYITHRS